MFRKSLIVIIMTLFPHFSGAQVVDPECAYTHFGLGIIHQDNGELDQALAEFQEAHRCDPTSIDILQHLQNTAFFLKDFELYHEFAQKIVQIDPDNYQALEDILDYYLMKEDIDQAVSYLEKLHRLDPDNRRYYQKLIAYYQKNERWDELLNVFQRLAEVDSLNGDRQFRIGLVHLNREDSLSALIAFEKANQLGFSDPLLYAKWAEILIRNKKLNSAKSIYERAFKENLTKPYFEQNLLHLYRDLGLSLDYGDSLKSAYPETPDLLQIWGRYALIIQELDYARQLFAELVDKHPDNVEYLFYLGAAYELQDQLSLARDTFRKVAENDSTLAQPWLNYANLSVKLSDEENALRGFTEFANRQNQGADPYYLLGLAYSQEEKWDQAQTHYFQALANDSTNIDILYSLGIVQFEAGREDSALATMHKVLKIFPEHPPANNFVGYAWADKGIKLDEAKVLIEKALVAEPENGFFLDSMGWVYFRLGETNQALEYLEKAVQFSANDPVILEHLGDVYRSINDVHKAREFWQRSLEQDPGNDNVKKKLEGLPSHD